MRLMYCFKTIWGQNKSKWWNPLWLHFNSAGSPLSCACEDFITSLHRPPPPPSQLSHLWGIQYVIRCNFTEINTHPLLTCSFKYSYLLWRAAKAFIRPTWPTPKTHDRHVVITLLVSDLKIIQRRSAKCTKETTNQKVLCQAMFIASIAIFFPPGLFFKNHTLDRQHLSHQFRLNFSLQNSLWIFRLNK